MTEAKVILKARRVLTPDEKDTAIELASEGKPLYQIREALACDAPSLVRAIRDDEDFAKRFASAREIGWHETAERVPNLADGVDNMVDFAAAKYKGEMTWRLLAVRMPKVYGERAEGDESQSPNLEAIVKARAALTRTRPTKQPLPANPDVKRLPEHKPSDTASDDDDDDLIG